MNLIYAITIGTMPIFNTVHIHDGSCLELYVIKSVEWPGILESYWWLNLTLDRRGVPLKQSSYNICSYVASTAKQ